MKRLLILTILALLIAIGWSVFAFAYDTASLTYDAYYNRRGQHFHVESSVGNTPTLIFRLWLDDDTRYDASGLTATFMYATNDFVTDITNMYPIAGTVSGSNVLVTVAANDFFTDIEDCYAVLRLTTSTEKHSYARGTISLNSSPEFDSGRVMVTNRPIDWSQVGPHSAIGSSFPFAAGSNVSLRAVGDVLGRYYIDVSTVADTDTTYTNWLGVSGWLSLSGDARSGSNTVSTVANSAFTNAVRAAQTNDGDTSYTAGYGLDLDGTNIRIHVTNDWQSGYVLKTETGGTNWYWAVDSEGSGSDDQTATEVTSTGTYANVQAWLNALAVLAFEGWPASDGNEYVAKDGAWFAHTDADTSYTAGYGLDLDGTNMRIHVTNDWQSGYVLKTETAGTNWYWAVDYYEANTDNQDLDDVLSRGSEARLAGMQYFRVTGFGDGGIIVGQNGLLDKIGVISTGGTETNWIYSVDDVIWFDKIGLESGAPTAVNEFSTDGSLSGNSDDAVPTEKAVNTAINNATSGVVLASSATAGDIMVYTGSAWATGRVEVAAGSGGITIGVATNNGTVTWTVNDDDAGGGGSSPQRPASLWRGNDLSPLVQDDAGWVVEQLDNGTCIEVGYGFRAVTNSAVSDTFAVDWQAPATWTSWSTNRYHYFADATNLDYVVTVYGVQEDANYNQTNMVSLYCATNHPSAADTPESFAIGAGDLSGTNYPSFVTVLEADTMLTNAIYWTEGTLEQ